ncbi:BTB/POZ protein [Rhizophagus irregularis DAOM 181602=DAOM 197198]|nr:BTB/POZ protein [Rhizophagus irregularis DAOM 181602=DAOM 197198]
MSSKFWAELSSDYEKLFETETGYDVIIYVGEEQNIKEIHAHSNVLCARSQYFRTAFSNEWAEKRDGKFIFKKSNISPKLFNIILRFIYCGNIELKTLQGPDVLEDDLIMNDIEIWEYLLKWCFAQQNMQNDPTKWNKDDIIRIERELYRFIPLIRFYDIEPTDFFYKVYCYKDILPQDLIHDLLEYYIVPNVKPKTNLPPSRKQRLDSTLIESNHIPLFASWIDKKDSSHYRKNVPYDFKLLYRSSQDGVDTKSFHKNCDNKGATIWIAKIKNSTQLIGGYNPLDWNGSRYQWETTADSFIFNSTNGKNISTSKVSYVKKQNRAVFCNYNYGPTMGNIYCDNNNWSNKDRGYGDDYPKIGIPENFEVEDYEVFQVIKK